MINLEKVFKKNEKKKFFILNKKAMSYGEFINKARTIACNILLEKGNLKGKVVFLKINRSVDYFISIFSLCYLEATIVPISPKTSNDEIMHLRKKFKPFLELNEIKNLLKN